MTPRFITPRSAAQGLGSAGHGTRHWWAQRASAAALVPLTLWLVVALAGGAAGTHTALVLWLATPLNAVLMILLVIAAFHHAALGLQVMAEDYIHSRARFVVIGCIQLACIAGGAAGATAVLLIALAG